MQPCKSGDQPYSDASPNGECSLVRLNLSAKEEQITLEKKLVWGDEQPYWPKSQTYLEGWFVTICCGNSFVIQTQHPTTWADTVHLLQRKSSMNRVYAVGTLFL